MASATPLFLLFWAFKYKNYMYLKYYKLHAWLDVLVKMYEVLNFSLFFCYFFIF